MSPPLDSGLRRSIRVILVAIALGLALGLTLRFAYEHHERVADRVAEEYAQRTQPVIVVDPRFKNVVITRFSAFGCVQVGGSVATDEDLAALHRIIETSPPPGNVLVRWSIRVAASSQTRTTLPP